MKRLTKTCFILLALAGFAVPATAQSDQGNLYELSLEELMNLTVVSASKEKERLFDAPLAAYSLTREEIVRSGALSIPEALRLIPGVIVRETTNGNYDIHLRGFDNTAKYTNGTNQINTLTLVMINNRPVYDYDMGGTSWEALPIDLADVERIEVVGGPSAPLFGPNAVTGVINIITREFSQKELQVSGQLQGSLPVGSFNSSLSVGKQVNSKLSLGLSGNYQKSMRLDDQQYIYATAGAPAYYMSSKEYMKERVNTLGLNPDVSLQRKGMNAYAAFKPKDGISFDFSTGAQAAESQKVYMTEGTPLSYTKRNSFYGNLNSKIHDLTLRISYLNGEDDLNRLSQDYTTGYDFRIMDVAADYDIRLHKTLRIRPSLGYQATRYSDLEQRKGFEYGGTMNGDHRMYLYSGSLRTDYTPLKGLRLTGSIRGDRFDVNHEVFISYQLSSTYAFNDNWMIRAVHARAHSGVFYSYAFANGTFPTNDPNTSIRTVANDHIHPTSNALTELGLRAQLMSNLQVDVTLFSQLLEDVSLFTYRGTETVDLQVYELYEPENPHFKAHQLGLTASVTWIPSRQWQLRPFITLQQTELHNFDYYNNPAKTGVAYQGAHVDHKNTPAVFGGWYINYTPLSRLNFNTSTYFFSDHHMTNLQDVEYKSHDGEISGKMLINAKASYLVYNKLGVFIGGRNLLNKNTREYYGTDRMGSQYFAGLSFNL